ncbi:MAG TPA: mechanosensitive ion channel family protein [Telluria sp.]|jgi:small-conductance mechanosensitive channel
MIERIPIRAYLPPVNIDLANAALALSAAVVSFVVLKVSLALVRRKLCALTDAQADHAWAQILKKTLASTSTLALVATALLIGLALLDLPAPWNERVKHLWFIGLGVQIAMYLHKGVAVATKYYFRRHVEAHGESETVAHTLIIWAVQSAVWIIFLLAMLANLGINITTFIASLGIGGIAIALAVQNILGDLFASLAIAVDKPFEVGDSISVTGFSGTVEHVGLKTTRVRSDSGEQVVISNTELLKSTVRNFKRMSRRRVQFSLFANPDTPAALAAKVPAEMRRIVEAQEQVQFDRAHLKSFNQSALEFDVVYYVLDSGYALFMDTQQAVLLEAMAALQRLGISTSTAQSHVVVKSEQPLRLAGVKAV